MMGWMFLFLLLAIVVIGCLFYLVLQIRRCYILRKLKEKSRLWSWLAPSIGVALIALLLFLTLGYMNASICIVFLSAFCGLCQFGAFLIQKITKRKFKRNYAALAGLFISVIYLSVGWYFAHDVRSTPYNLTTNKLSEEIRIVHFADSHVGATFDAEKFSDYVDEMKEQKPDLALITGDFVDDDTSRDDMLKAAAALKKMDATYGVYFVLGNHDLGYSSAESRGWTKEELFEALRASNVTILQDEAVVIADSINLIGRLDASRKNRKSMAELTYGLDMTKYTIVLDHQPIDYDAQEESGVDLVLSGHTHGGQLFPVNIFIALSNDNSYGHEKRNNTDFIVTSGIGDWAIKFKIGCIAEYVVIDIKGDR